MNHLTTILIVDDEPAGLETLEGLLINQGYNLVFTNSGVEALKKAQEFTPDLILLDVMMPGMDGFEVCRYLRADSLLAEIPIIFVTALDDRDSRLQGIEAGADDFVTKPFDRVELRTRVQTITRLNRFRRLLSERNKFEWVVDQAEDGYLIVGDQGEIHYANQKARLYLNLTGDRNRTISKRFQELIHEQYRCEPQEAWTHGGWPQQSPLAEQMPRYLVRPESALANAFWLQVDLLQVDLALGSDTTWVIRLRDVTEQMNMQRSTWQFQAMVSHKLRTPLVHMIGGMELLANYAQDLSPDEVAQLAKRALQSVQRLRSEVDDIIQHTSISTRPQPGLGQEFELGQLEALVIELCADLELPHAILFKDQALNGSKVMLGISRPAIKLIMRELLENTKKFHPEKKPRIEISVEIRNPGEAVIRITDDGLTLSPEQLQQVWTPYYQGEKYFTGEAAGMGLGLPMVAATVWSAGGTCRMYNRESGSGITVELVLPLEASRASCIPPLTKMSFRERRPAFGGLLMKEKHNGRI
ncbi:MAG: response regulator [Anaerolineae bacterium]|nr:response regulator [Anaerolineae bacterium]